MRGETRERKGKKLATFFVTEGTDLLLRKVDGGCPLAVGLVSNNHEACTASVV
jgi:hypothetical protein